MTNLTNRTWWKDASLRALYTAFAIALPYLGGALIADIPWLTIASAAGLGFLASLATSLAGLPEAAGVNLPWWLAAVERVVKTFAQALAAGFIGATLLTDVEWSTVLQASLLAALTSLVRLILATLPADPTAKQSHTITVNTAADPDAIGAVVSERLRAVGDRLTGSAVAVDDVIDVASQDRYPLVVDTDQGRHYRIPSGLPGQSDNNSDS